MPRERRSAERLGVKGQLALSTASCDSQRAGPPRKVTQSRFKEVKIRLPCCRSQLAEICFFKKCFFYKHLFSSQVKNIRKSWNEMKTSHFGSQIPFQLL